ncbi:hypothetical protein BDA99DRAFT_511454 [Phascolomyces articulosus]|uniref:Uncharacterized protein n=1 Tax=Phascolomyces articulosus TaxID=60185 RepID=A0AAD5PD79_9FUNG|nr:hypothetical protein BDA99DRAFT_511454 [Phascolomyces articulosus]
MLLFYITMIKKYILQMTTGTVIFFLSRFIYYSLLFHISKSKQSNEFHYVRIIMSD